MPTLDRITVYPVKSLDGVDLTEAVVLPSGALEHDRRWQLTDIDGRVLNAKRSPLFHAIRAEFDLAARLVTLSIDPLAGSTIGCSSAVTRAAAGCWSGSRRSADRQPVGIPAAMSIVAAWMSTIASRSVQ